MAKVISQETFDDVVRENMEEFDMSVDEAIEDAVSQFESQGVNLLNIIRDPNLFTNGSSGQTNHAVIQALQKVKSSVESHSVDDLRDSLTIFQAECEEDLARRCMAGKNEGYKILMEALTSFKSSTELTAPILKAFCAMINGQPDLLDADGVIFLLNCLKETTFKEKHLLIKLIRLFCVKHEENRQVFIKNNIIELLSELLANRKSDPELVTEICICFRVLTLDDDVRVPFGKAHEHAKMIVTEGDALKRILDICQDYSEEVAVLGELWSTLGCLAVRDEFCKEVLEMGGLTLILNSFEKNIGDKNLTRKSLAVMKALAGNDNVKVAIVKSGGIELIVASMLQHQSNASISEAACATLSTVALRNPSNSQKIVECNGHQAIVQCMKIHPSVLGVQKQGCMALRNIVSRNRVHCDAILELGAEEVIKKARLQHKNLDDEAKAALRDLGCKVDLQEQWKGEHGSLVHN